MDRIVKDERYVLYLGMTLACTVAIALYIGAKTLSLEGYLFAAFEVIIPMILVGSSFKPLDHYDYKDYIAKQERELHQIKMMEERETKETNMTKYTSEGKPIEYYSAGTYHENPF